MDLGGTSPPSNPISATAPYGMAFGNSISGGGAGWSVSDLGDVNGDGYDDFMIGAPTVSSPSTIGSGINGEAFLIFGSKTVNASAITDWIGKTSTSPLTYTYTANDRVGNLGQLGAATQTNPDQRHDARLPLRRHHVRHQRRQHPLGPGGLGRVGEAQHRRLTAS